MQADRSSASPFPFHLQVAAAPALNAIDALQMQQFMAQGFLAGGTTLPVLMPGAEAALGQEVPAAAMPEGTQHEQPMADAAVHDEHSAGTEAAEQQQQQQQPLAADNATTLAAAAPSGLGE